MRPLHQRSIRSGQRVCRIPMNIFSCMSYYARCPGNWCSLFIAFVGLFWIAMSPNAADICYRSTLLFPVIYTLRILWIGEQAPIYTVERMVIYWLLVIVSFLFDHFAGFLRPNHGQPIPLYFLIKTLILTWCMIPDYFNGVQFLKDLRDGLLGCRWDIDGQSIADSTEDIRTSPNESDRTVYLKNSSDNVNLEVKSAEQEHSEKRENQSMENQTGQRTSFTDMGKTKTMKTQNEELKSSEVNRTPSKLLSLANIRNRRSKQNIRSKDSIEITSRNEKTNV
ncbi:hypothetical protein ACOME3_001626 [Neoechinorhynchus agilis]